MNTTTLTTPDGQSYPVVTGRGFLKDIGSILAERTTPCRVMLVSDSNVAPLYADKVRISLEKAGFSVHVHTVMSGESSKSVAVFGELLEAMAEAKMTRTDLAVALGGGVVGDLTGFAAGCYLRGIRFVQLPTTLLAAVDASVGGKTAVNLEHGKNLAGLFHQPIGVYCDADTLKTLHPHELSDGAAEAIKAGILGDESLFSIFENGDPAAQYEEIIAKAVAYKARIVMEDPEEKTVRKLLNLGHTPAHAIEKLSNFRISHGHAVGIGIAMMSRAAVKEGILEKREFSRIVYVLKRSGLPTFCPFAPDEMAKIAAIDKKASARNITVILPEKIGQCRMQTIRTDALKDLFSEALEGQA